MKFLHHNKIRLLRDFVILYDQVYDQINIITTFFYVLLDEMIVMRQSQ